MILIFAQSFEETTCDVIAWLIYFKKKFIRINLDKDICNSFHIELPINKVAHIKFHVSNHEIDISEITAFWYRRGGYLKILLDNTALSQFLLKQTLKFSKEINRNLQEESYFLSSFIDRDFSSLLPNINSAETASPNKLNVLTEASKVGLLIPPTLITTQKEDVINFKLKHKSIITKAINESLHFSDENAFYSVYTEEIVTLDNIPDIFFPSLFQKKLEKEYEIRTFYLWGKFYSMAIFSQEIEQTKVDFRKYSKEIPNRYVPYCLPKAISMKLKRLMDNLKLNSGSIDLVYTKDEDYYFLEVNPVGQFSMVSEPCNYYLERIVAQKLSENEK
ncbi:MAG: grasp-with-spasm system ATP-grasp peptide maturase [Oscillibacter sp.]|nr:grasp-with-spasm system ATP-grasp peptide maturase [Oscillibacter sp.]